MALKAIVYKASMNVADMSRHVYMEQTLTLAKHPSETDVRLMLRLFAWSLYADERLVFTKGLSDDSEPALWIKNYSDEIELWIDLGLPDEKRIKKACSLAKQVVLFTYEDNAARVWKENCLHKLYPFKNLTIINLKDEVLHALAAVCNRTMIIQSTIEDQLVWFSVDEHAFSIELDVWKKADEATN